MPLYSERNQKSSVGEAGVSPARHSKNLHFRRRKKIPRADKGETKPRGGSLGRGDLRPLSDGLRRDENREVRRLGERVVKVGVGVLEVACANGYASALAHLEDGNAREGRNRGVAENLADTSLGVLFGVLGLADNRLGVLEVLEGFCALEVEGDGVRHW